MDYHCFIFIHTLQKYVLFETSCVIKLMSFLFFQIVLPKHLESFGFFTTVIYLLIHLFYICVTLEQFWFLSVMKERKLKLS